MRFSTRQQLRQIWFQLHKWIGLTLAVLIIPISLTGAALVWHDALEEALNPKRAADAAPALPPSAYAAAARELAAPGETLISLGYPEERGAVVATLLRTQSPAGGRPVRTILHLDPERAGLLDRSASNEGAVHVMHVLHGSLMVPGVGRKIVGCIGLAMLLSSLTGLWLWWPIKGSFRRGLRWDRQPTTSGNLHHQAGFWIALPLAVLSLTGVWISFPGFFAQIAGEPLGPSPAERMRRIGAVPMVETRLTAEQAIALAEPHSTGGLTMISWPTESDAKWKVSYRRQGGGPAEVQVDDAAGTVAAPVPPQPETTVRLMRRIHDGTGMGPVWQTIIFIGGIIPAILAVTGILMWLNVRRRRTAMEERRAARVEPVPAE